MNSFIFLLVLCSPLITLSSFLPLSSASTYNPTLASKLWDICMSSYCPVKRIQDWNVGFVSEAYPSVRDITVLYNTTGNAMGFTAYNPIDDEVWLIFRGTEPLSIKNWIDDIDTFYIDYPRCQGCKVHEGFYKTYQQIRAQVKTAAQDLYSKYPQSKKVVTGHSLGGALAVEAIMDIVENFGAVHEFYTFGAPRGGNQAFVDFINGKISTNFNSRITHARDPVPHLPLFDWGFRHLDTEIFYADSNYIICNKGEDPNCSNKYQVDINVLDHLAYMGKSMIGFYLECKL